VFSLDTLSDKTFAVSTAVSMGTLLLSTVFAPLQSFLEMTSLNARQWLICGLVALTVLVASEVRKAVLRRG
jgi:P-type Ca2+ transporter type 2C